MPFIKGQQAWNQGKKMPFTHRKMKPGFMPVKAFKKGNEPWNKGKAIYQTRDEKNGNWIGDNVGYAGIHDWVEVRLGRPKECEQCGTKEDRVYHWSNKSGEYKRDLNDWWRLCVPCHKKYDLSRKNK